MKKYEIDYITLKHRVRVKNENRLSDEICLTSKLYTLTLISTTRCVKVEIGKSTTLIPYENVKSIIMKDEVDE